MQHPSKQQKPTQTNQSTTGVSRPSSSWAKSGSKQAASQHHLLQQSLNSHNTTFDKLQNLKPLRETQNQLNSSSSQRHIGGANNVGSSQSKRDKTPIQAQKYQKESRQLLQTQDYLQTENYPVHHQIANITISDSKTPTKSKQVYDVKEQVNSVKQQHHLEKWQPQAQKNQSKSQDRLTQQTLVRADFSGYRENLDIYVVRGRKTQQQKQQAVNQPEQQLQKQALPSNSRTQRNVIEGKITQSKGRDRSKTPEPSQQQKSSGKHFSNQSSVMLHSVLKQSVATFPKRQDSSKYSAVKSKVSQHLRSKTPNGKGAILTQQQLMDQNDRKQRRDYEIQLLENEVQQIQHDLLFVQSNKELMFDIFKPRDKASVRRMISEVSGADMNGECEEQGAVVKIESKRQFSNYEYQLQNHKFSDKYFDKVYLELCGFKDLHQGKLQHLEAHKQKPYASKTSLGSAATASTQMAVDANSVSRDMTGSMTFFEKRSDYAKDRAEQFSQISHKYSVVNLDSAFQTQEAGLKHNDEDFKSQALDGSIIAGFDSNLGTSEQRLQIQLLREENQRLVLDFDKTLEELTSQRKTASNMAFYEAIHEYQYDKKQLDSALYKDPQGFTQVAQSPTKRLICMKNSSVEHYRHIRESNLLEQFREESGDKRSSRVYMASPERAYVVQQEKQIDYELAFKKNPLQFYEEALNAPITRHKIQNQRVDIMEEAHSEKRSTLGSASSHSLSQRNALQTTQARGSRQRDHEMYTVNSKHTTRPHQRINQKIKSRIQSKLAAKLGSNLTEQVLQALEDANLQQAIQDIISENSSQNLEQEEEQPEKYEDGDQFDEYREQQREEEGRDFNPLDSESERLHTLENNNQQIDTQLAQEDGNGFLFSCRNQDQEWQQANLMKAPAGSNANSKHGKAFSVHSALIQRQSQLREGNASERNSKALMASAQGAREDTAQSRINGLEDNEPEQRQQQVFSIQKHNRQKSNQHPSKAQALIAKEQRSGASSRFYQSEANAHTEENVRVNRAY